jgi:hypothetical protein
MLQDRKVVFTQQPFPPERWMGESLLHCNRLLAKKRCIHSDITRFLGDCALDLNIQRWGERSAWKGRISGKGGYPYKLGDRN